MISVKAAHATCLFRASTAAISVPALCLLVILNSDNLSYKGTVRLESSVSLVFPLRALWSVYTTKLLYSVKNLNIFVTAHTISRSSLSVFEYLCSTAFSVLGAYFSTLLSPFDLICVSTAPRHDPDALQKIFVFIALYEMCQNFSLTDFVFQALKSFTRAFIPCDMFSIANY
jgi:hypothetical protein